MDDLAAKVQLLKRLVAMRSGMGPVAKGQPVQRPGAPSGRPRVPKGRPVWEGVPRPGGPLRPGVPTRLPRTDRMRGM